MSGGHHRSSSLHFVCLSLGCTAAGDRTAAYNTRISGGAIKSKLLSKSEENWSCQTQMHPDQSYPEANGVLEAGEAPEVADSKR